MAQSVPYSEIEQRAQDFNFNGVYAKDTRINEAAIRSALEELVTERRWTFYEKSGFVTTVAPIDISDAGATQGSATVTSASAAAAHVGKFLRINGQSKLYKITAASVGVSWTIERVYVGDAVVAGTATVETPVYDLPSDIEELVELIDLDVKQHPLPDVPWVEMQLAYNDGANTGAAQFFAQQPDPDDNDAQIAFWPVPDDVREYQVTYYRKTTLPDKDSQSANIDWPDAYRMLFEAAVERQIARRYADKAPGWYGIANQRYHELLEKAASKDGKKVLGRKVGNNRQPRGHIWWRGPNG